MCIHMYIYIYIHVCIMTLLALNFSKKWRRYQGAMDRFSLASEAKSSTSTFHFAFFGFYGGLRV